MTQLPEPASGCWNPHFGCFNSIKLGFIERLGLDCGRRG
uniref:Uncharacterized protein n=1 Tax=Rhizophora mucronata TaxID=61149 RepID=A0A2P2JPY3_RHIMU